MFPFEGLKNPTYSGESSSISGNTLSIQALNTNVTSIAPPAAHTNVSLVSPGTTVSHNLVRRDIPKVC